MSKANDPESTERIKLPAKGPSSTRSSFTPAQLQQFIVGQITFGELEGITKREQYKIAEVGYRLLTEGKLESAKKIFDGLMALDPRDPYFNTVLGSIAQQRGDLASAHRLYSRAIELDPTSPVAHANRGEILLLLARAEEGMADLRRALELDPDAKETSTKRAKVSLRAIEVGQQTLPQTPVAPAAAPARAAPGGKPKARP